MEYKGYTLRTASPFDALDVECEDIDRKEIEGYLGVNPKEAALIGIDMSIKCFSLLTPEKRVAFISGLSQSHLDPREAGWVWMISGQREFLHPIRKKIFENSRRVIEYYHMYFKRLHTVLLMENQVHVRWLLALGFEPVSYFTKSNMTYIEMERTA